MRFTVLAISALSFTLISLLSFSAFGQESPNYLALKAGFYAPTGDLDDLNLDEGFHGEIAFGRYLHSTLALELGFGYFKSEGDLSVIPVTLNAKWFIVNNRVEVFGEVGVGAYFADLDGVISTPTSGNISINDDETVFGIDFGLGARYNFSRNVFIGFEGKYIATADAEFQGMASGVPTKVKSDLNGFLVTGNLGFRF